MHVGYVGGLLRIVLVSLIGIVKRISCSHYFLPGAAVHPYINIHLVECIFLFMMISKAVICVTEECNHDC